MSRYNLINNITGWIVFLAATISFTLTLEPTVSFWDCGEFIAGAYKLQVVHPPGAPLFLLVARMFTLFAPTPEDVAWTVNFLSGLGSGFAILFLFWTITALGRKILKPDNAAGHSTGQVIAIMGAGITGALSCAYADSFWFSAVEGEVYALSAFFTALVFWLIFKWENRADEPHSDRWLILIAFLMGLSIGVHLLNLLAIPAIVFVYYLRKYEPSKWGVVKALIASIVILGFIQYGIATMVLPQIAAKLDVFFVNSLGLPFWSGAFFLIFIVIALIISGLIYTKRKGNPQLYTVILGIMMVMVGYSTYIEVVVRSDANPPIDMNDPEDVFRLSSYLSREQYGDRPLLYGPYFTANLIDIKDGGPRYYKDEEKGKYLKIGYKSEPVYEEDKQTIFPRIWSNDRRHANFYRNWLDLNKGEQPSFADNIRFFFEYQLGWMYWRYFMWNFSGRQNDRQGHGGVKDGNWITGIDFLDKIRLGSQNELPEIWKEDKSRNTFFMLPFILGLAGMIYHFSRNKKDASIVALLFFFTGIAIVLYLNQNPLQPRERDYSYAGSFYAWAIWIGIGLLAVYEWLRSKVKNKPAAAGIAFAACFLASPFLMGYQGWDDHDRSNRYTARDFAVNYLESCAPNAILFTQGDNDTYPLWYAQEVEGIRTDVRVVNLSLLGVDWYIDHLKYKINDADPVPITMSFEKYRGSNRDQVIYYENPQLSKDKYYPLQEVMKFISNDKTKIQLRSGESINYLPTQKLAIPVDPEEAVKNGIVDPEDKGKVVPIKWTLKKNRLLKNDLMTLEILANALWKRPVYFAISVSPDSYLGLQPYFRQEGLTYRVVPLRSETEGPYGTIAPDIMYNNIMTEFKWGNMDSEDPIYLNEDVIRMTMNFRNNFARLADALLNEGKKQEAINVLDKCVEVMPHRNVPYNVLMIRIADLYYKTGEVAKGGEVVKTLAEVYSDELEYYFTLPSDFLQQHYKQEMNQAMAVMQELSRMTQNHDKELSEEIKTTFQELSGKYMQMNRD